MSQTISTLFLYALQITIAIVLLNVWLVRFNRPTKYRGVESQNMKEEFAAYGLPEWFLYVVGFLKISIAAIMSISVFASKIIYPLDLFALGVLIILMLGAIAMHIKVKDPLIKALPAIAMFIMATLSAYWVHLFR